MTEELAGREVGNNHTVGIDPICVLDGITALGSPLHSSGEQQPLIVSTCTRRSFGYNVVGS